MLSEPWVADQYVKAVKFPDYPGTKPHIDGIDFKIFAEIETAYLEFQAGTVDFTQISSGKVQTAKTTYGVVDQRPRLPSRRSRFWSGAELAIYYSC